MYLNFSPASPPQVIMVTLKLPSFLLSSLAQCIAVGMTASSVLWRKCVLCVCVLYSFWLVFQYRGVSIEQTVFRISIHFGLFVQAVVSLAPPNFQFQDGD